MSSAGISIEQACEMLNIWLMIDAESVSTFVTIVVDSTERLSKAPGLRGNVTKIDDPEGDDRPRHFIAFLGLINGLFHESGKRIVFHGTNTIEQFIVEDRASSEDDFEDDDDEDLSW